MPENATKPTGAPTFERRELLAYAHDHLATVAPLLDRIGHGSGDLLSVGYVEYDGLGADELTKDLGWTTVDAAREMARHSSDYLDQEVVAKTTGHDDSEAVSATFDTAHLLGVVAAALDGIKPDSMLPPPALVTWALSRMVRDQLRSVRALQHADGDVETAFTTDPLEALKDIVGPLQRIERVGARLYEELPEELSRRVFKGFYMELEGATVGLENLIEDLEEDDHDGRAIRHPGAEAAPDAAPALRHATEALKALAWVPPESDDTPFTVIQDARAQLVNVVDTLRAEVEAASHA